MDKKTFCILESYMKEMMKDSTHDFLHVYRVLYQALRIAKGYDHINRDILIASCLLHDIGRQKQFQNPQLCHAIEGGKMAYSFMENLGWSKEDCKHVQDCITTHRFQADDQPKTLEAKILFDADKLDVTGALGIARSLMYKGQLDEPLYVVNGENKIYEGQDSHEPESFLKECHLKLIPLYDKFYTEEAYEIAKTRKNITMMFYSELMNEISINDLSGLLDELWIRRR